MESLILTLGFMGVVIAILTPLIKTGSAVTLGSFIIYFTVIGVETWLPVILFTLGLFLIVVEVFIPDFGLVGILGIGSIILGLYLTIGDLGRTVQDLSVAIIITTVLVVYLIRKGYSLTNLNKIVLHTNSSDAAEEAEDDEDEQDDIIKPGTTGVTQTPLRPSGKVVFDESDGTQFDVLSSEGHISNGTPVVIKKVHGTKIIVQKHK